MVNYIPLCNLIKCRAKKFFTLLRPLKNKNGCNNDGQHFKRLNFKIKMSIETERKFLVKGDFTEYSIRKIEITQMYLSADPLKTIRIRIADNEAFLTIKSPRYEDSFSRGEWEYEIPVDDARELMKICLPGKVVKTRHIVPAGNLKFEVDVFHEKNEGLVIAEIELSSENETFPRPVWLGKEVTSDPQYYSSNLRK
jgi:adenylate cyclase